MPAGQNIIVWCQSSHHAAIIGFLHGASQAVQNSGQDSRINGQLAINKVNGIIGGSIATWSNGIGAGIYSPLAVPAISQGAAQNIVSLTRDKAAKTDPITTAISCAVIVFGIIISCYRQISRVNGQGTSRIIDKIITLLI